MWDNPEERVLSFLNKVLFNDCGIYTTDEYSYITK